VKLLLGEVCDCVGRILEGKAGFAINLFHLEMLLSQIYEMQKKARLPGAAAL